MAQVVVTLKVMPDSPDVDLGKVLEGAKKVIEKHGSTLAKNEREPVAFGLFSLKLIFAVDEDKGSPDEIEEGIKELHGVQSCETVDARRLL